MSTPVMQSLCKLTWGLSLHRRGHFVHSGEITIIFEKKGYNMSLTRKKQFLLKLTDHEYEMIQEKMKQCGVRNMSAFIRKMAIDGLVVNLDLPAFREMLRLVTRTAANVNQIAVHCNTTGGISKEELQELRDGYREQAEQIKKMIAELVTVKSLKTVR